MASDFLNKMESQFLSVKLLSSMLLVLTAIASAGGLFMSNLYRDTAWVIPQSRGQDFVTLFIALPVLCIVLFKSRLNSPRAILVWLGIIGYLLYTATGAAFAYALNSFFLLYVGQFSVALFTLIFALTGVEAKTIQKSFDERTPKKAVSLFLVLIAFGLIVLWLGQLAQFFVKDQLPEGVKLGGNGMIFIYVLDLGVIVPLALLAATWLWLERAWGYILASVVLVKATSMGFALLGMSWFAYRADQLSSAYLIIPWLIISLGGLAMTVWFLSHSQK